MNNLYAIVKIESDKQYLIRNIADHNALLVFDSETDAEIYKQIHCKGGKFVVKAVTVNLAKKEIENGKEL